MRDNLHALDAGRDVQFQALMEPGSADLQELFARRPELHLALANDTSAGVGHAPLSPLECLVLNAERRINGRDRWREHPGWGEDVKIMGLRNGGLVHLTAACAMIGRHLAHIDDYLAEKAAIEKLLAELAIQRLITPCRPMSLEAAAGKNPVTHVGKIYNVLAGELAEALVTNIAEIAAAHCLVASRIGRPIATPAALQVKVATRDGCAVESLRPRVEEIAGDCLSRLPKLVDRFLAGAINVF